LDQCYDFEIELSFKASLTSVVSINCNIFGR